MVPQVKIFIITNGGNKKDKDNQTFIFSLNLMKKYDMINKENTAIRCVKTIGLILEEEIFLLKKIWKKGKTYVNLATNFLSNNDLELIGEKGNYKVFDIEDFEVFKII